MSELPLHPALVHLPLGVAMLLPVLAGALTFALWKERLPRSAWLLVLLSSALGLAGAFAARATGEREEDRVEDWVSRRDIHQHEEAADAFVVALALVTVSSAAVFLLKKPKPFKVGLLVVTLGFWAVLALALNVGHLGGELVYRHNAGALHAPD